MLDRIERELAETNTEIGSSLRILRPDSDGNITVRELEDALSFIQANPEDERIKILLKKLDTDGDGKLSFQEVAKLGHVEEEESEGSGVTVDKDGKRTVFSD